MKKDRRSLKTLPVRGSRTALRGYTLAEVLVAMMVTAVLLAAFFTFVANRQQALIKQGKSHSEILNALKLVSQMEPLWKARLRQHPIRVEEDLLQFETAEAPTNFLGETKGEMSRVQVQNTPLSVELTVLPEGQLVPLTKKAFTNLRAHWSESSNGSRLSLTLTRPGGSELGAWQFGY